MVDEDTGAQISALRRSLKQVLRSYMDGNDENELFDVNFDPAVTNAQHVLADVKSSWFAVEYKLMGDVVRAATVFLKNPDKSERLRDALTALQEHRK